MSDPIADLGVVALLPDLPDDGLERGQTGTIVLTHNNGEAFEVEFIPRPAESGRPIVATICAADLLKLKAYKRVAAASA